MGLSHSILALQTLPNCTCCQFIGDTVILNKSSLDWGALSRDFLSFEGVGVDPRLVPFARKNDFFSMTINPRSDIPHRCHHVTSGDVTGAGGKGSNLKIKKILLPPFNPPMHIPCSRRNHNEKPHPLSGPLTKKELLDQNRELTAPMDWVASRPSPHMSRYE